MAGLIVNDPVISAKAAVITAVSLSLSLGSVLGCDSTSSDTTTLDGQQQYGSAQQLADELTARGHRCDMRPESGGDYFDDSGACYLGGTSGPEVVLVIYSSQSQLDDYFTEVPTTDYAWLFGKNWGINCWEGQPATCNELQAALGGTIKRASDELPQEVRPKT